MSDQQSSEDTATCTYDENDSLNNAHLLSPSDMMSSPPTCKDFSKTKSLMKRFEIQEDQSDQNWRVMLAKSIEQCKRRTPQNYKGHNKQQRQQEKTADVKNKKSGKLQDLCPICLCEYQNTHGSLDCLHEFCFQCIEKWCQSSTICPCCRKPITSILKMVRDQSNGPVRETKRITVEKRELVFESDYDHYVCYECHSGENQHILLICDQCDFYCCHVYCDAQLNNRLPQGNWYCIYCRMRSRRSERVGFLSVREIEMDHDASDDSQQLEEIQQESEKGVSSRTRSHEGFGQVVHRNNMTILRNIRRRVR